MSRREETAEELICRWTLAELTPTSVVDFGTPDGRYLAPFFRLGRHVLGRQEGKLPRGELLIENIVQLPEPGPEFRVGYYELGLSFWQMSNVPIHRVEAAVKAMARTVRVLLFASGPSRGEHGGVMGRNLDEWQATLTSFGFAVMSRQRHSLHAKLVEGRVPEDGPRDVLVLKSTQRKG